MFFIYNDTIFHCSPHSEVPSQNGVITMAENLHMTEEEIEVAQTEYASNEIKGKRAKEYPPITDYLDGIVKGDLVQQQAYIDACQAVKDKYPKEVK